MDVYILAGQSNMSGRGALADLTVAEATATPGNRLFGNDGIWRDAAEPLDDATGQTDAVSADARAGVGPGLFFARALGTPRSRTVALVPCAKGGSSIARWAPNMARDTLYGSCIARVRAAGGRLAGILWYQGETDARDPAVAARWSAAFAGVVQAFRRDLDAPRLAVALVQLSDRPARPQDAESYPGWEAIRRQQAELRLPCTAWVPSAGLPRLADDLHLATAAQRVVGTRLADAMRRLHTSGCR